MTTVHAAPSELPSSPDAADAAPLPAALASSVLLLRFATTMAVLLAVASLPRSAFLPLRDIHVVGTDQVSVAEVIAHSELQVGDQFFAIPVAEVTARILRIPRISAVDVRLGRLGQVIIRVKERTPYAALAFNGKYLLLDRTGVALEFRPDPFELPILSVEGTGLVWAQLGTRLSALEALHILEVLPLLPAGIVRPGLQVKRGANGDLTLVTADGITVLLGPPRGLRERLTLLEPLLGAIRQQLAAVEYLDLRFAGNAVVKPVRTVPAGVRP